MTGDVKVVRHHGGSGSIMGPLWFAGWLFTIGYLKLTFWKGVLALIVWPYYLGVFFHNAPGSK